MQNMHMSGGPPTGMAHPGKGQPRDGTTGASKHKFGQRATLGGDESTLPRTPARGPITNNHRIGTDVKQMRSFPTIPVN